MVLLSGLMATALAVVAIVLAVPPRADAKPKAVRAAKAVRTAKAATIPAGLSPATTMSWGRYRIPTNTATGKQGVGSVCVELHLPTSKKDPLAAGAYRELAGLDRVSVGGSERDYSTRKYLTPKRGKTWPGGAFGYMEPEQEQWYMNMRWNFVDWTGRGHTANPDWTSLEWHKDHRKVLVTNLETGKRAIGYMGDSGPALGLGSPEDNRIAGLSPDLMYYLSNQSGEGTRTPFGADNATDYKFEWVLDQSLPLGPVGDAPLPNAKPAEGAARAAKAVRAVGLARKLLPDAAVVFYVSQMPSGGMLGVPLPEGTASFLGGDTAVVVGDGVSPVTEWSAGTAATLPPGSAYPVLEQAGGWFRVRLDADRTGWVPASAVVLADR